MRDPAPRRAAILLAALALAAAGCAKERKPVIPRAAFVERESHRDAIEARDTTLARLTYPDFVGARTGDALDSLRAAVADLLVAAPGGGAPAAPSPAALMDRFIADWNATRKSTRSRAYWRLDRHVEVLAETLGVVGMACSEFLDTGGAHPMSTVKLLNIDADDGRTLSFDDFFRAGSRDSLGAALEARFRETRGITPDSSLKAAGFEFPGDRFQVNANFAVSATGLRWHFDPYEIAPYAWGPTDLAVPFVALRRFARPDGPLGAKPR